MDFKNPFQNGNGVLAKSDSNFSPPGLRPMTSAGDDGSDGEGSNHRIAHTLTACCRCRQRKTRCDPTLPRCLPCERSGSHCEYFDTARNKKIPRFYVVKLQEKVRQLEADLAKLTHSDADLATGGPVGGRNDEDLVRPGGLVRLSEADATPRYLGPSSGIAMTRLLMEQAKRYTNSKQISELIPEVRARRMERLNRMHSISYSGPAGRGSLSGPLMAGSLSARKKSFPMISAHPATTLPRREIAEKLVEVFHQRAQYFTPTLHEVEFARDLDDIYKGNTDPYKNFVVRMVLAISLQKLDTQYAGLADSYYLAAIQQFEDVVRPKDLKTLQCLVLIGLYSLLTPTRTATYHVIGLATRICQQLGLTDEDTISAGYSLGLIDPLEMDMRRRLSWIVTGNEYGLAHATGRPNGFAKMNDFMNVKYFATVADRYITREGINPQAPPCHKKAVAIHFCKMRIRQAEIKRIMYEKKRAEPRDENSLLFLEMEQRVRTWLAEAPDQPAWCRPWFTGRHHTMIISINRPSPQIPRPSSRSAMKCYDSSVYIIDISAQQVKKGAVDVTWVFLLTLNMSLNVLIWTISYYEVRQAHPKAEVEELIHVALDVIEQCAERWPGTRNTAQLYLTLANACLKSYDTTDDPNNLQGDREPTDSPALTADNSSTSQGIATPPTVTGASWQNQQPVFSQPFGTSLDPLHSFGLEDPFQQPTFRSNSIFDKPSSEERRPSIGYFSPDSKPSDSSPDANQTTPSATEASQRQTTTRQQETPNRPALPQQQSSNATLSPPLTVISGGGATPQATRLASPDQLVNGPALPKQPLAANVFSTDATHLATPQSMADFNAFDVGPTSMSPPLMTTQAGAGISTQMPTSTASGLQQRPLPQPSAQSDWYTPQAPHDPLLYDTTNSDLSSNNFDMSSTGFWSDSAAADAAFGGLNMVGGSNFDSDFLTMMQQPLGNKPMASSAPFPKFNDSNNNMMTSNGGLANGKDPTLSAIPPMTMSSFLNERHGSLSQVQQSELMDILEEDGIGDINNYLGMGMDLDGLAQDENLGAWS